MGLIPPALNNPTVIELAAKPTVTKMDVTRDYVIVLPKQKKEGSTTLIGGRNIVIVGGTLAVTEDDKMRRALYIKGATGTVHVEGVYFDMAQGGEADAIVIAAPAAAIQIENVRIDGVHGHQQSWHADVIQPWGGARSIAIDGLTATTSYQGIQLTSLKAPIGTLTITRTNIVGIDKQIWSSGFMGGNGGYLFWAQCDLTARVVFDQFYLKPRDERGPRLAAYPPANTTTACPTQLSKDGLSVSFPNHRSITGVIRLGKPPRGDFVAAGSVGVGYRRSGRDR